MPKFKNFKERGLAHLCTVTKEAAPPFAVFEGWVPQTTVSRISGK